MNRVKKYVQDEVFLQFSGHFSKLGELSQKSDLKRIDIQTKPVKPSAKTNLMSMKLLELENKQIMELDAVRM